MIDGVDVRDVDLAQQCSQIAIVPQETHLFGFSIKENAACGKPNASEDEIVHAIERNKARVLVGAGMHLLDLGKRLMPVAFEEMLARYLGQ